MIATFFSNFVSTYVKVFLHNSITDILGQFACERAKQPSAPILFDQKSTFYNFSDRIFAIYLHSSSPKE
jgi:hypothetical protein